MILGLLDGIPADQQQRSKPIPGYGQPRRGGCEMSDPATTVMMADLEENMLADAVGSGTRTDAGVRSAREAAWRREA